MKGEEGHMERHTITLMLLKIPCRSGSGEEERKLEERENYGNEERREDKGMREKRVEGETKIEKRSGRLRRVRLQGI